MWEIYFCVVSEIYVFVFVCEREICLCWRERYVCVWVRDMFVRKGDIYGCMWVRDMFMYGWEICFLLEWEICLFGGVRDFCMCWSEKYVYVQGWEKFVCVGVRVMFLWEWKIIWCAMWVIWLWVSERYFWFELWERRKRGDSLCIQRTQDTLFKLYVNIQITIIIFYHIFVFCF